MRYIDADALLNNLPDDLPYKASVKRVLIQAPTTDVVEVVRCRDCRHYKGEQFNCWVMRSKMQPNDYCSYGERREDK